MTSNMTQSLWIVGLVMAYGTVGCKHDRVPAAGATVDAAGSTESTEFAREMSQCDRDDAKACYRAGLALRDATGVPRNEMLAARMLTKACQRVPDACNDLGEMYRIGKGVSKDPAAAAHNYQLACDGGDVFGCANFAQSLAAGVGVEKDASRAAQLFQRACDAKDISSCYNAGVAYDNGIGVRLDHARAAKDYDLACNGGLAMACSNLGLLLAKGNGVPTSESAALERLERGCAGEIAESCRNAGVLLKKTKVDREGRTPGAFFSRACKLGDRAACAEVNSGSL
jgi:TPR repeat protein